MFSERECDKFFLFLLLLFKTVVKFLLLDISGSSIIFNHLIVTETVTLFKKKIILPIVRVGYSVIPSLGCCDCVKCLLSFSVLILFQLHWSCRYRIHKGIFNMDDSLYSVYRNWPESRKVIHSTSCSAACFTFWFVCPAGTVVG